MQLELEVERKDDKSQRVRVLSLTPYIRTTLHNNLMFYDFFLGESGLDTLAPAQPTSQVNSENISFFEKRFSSSLREPAKVSAAKPYHSVCNHSPRTSQV